MFDRGLKAFVALITTLVISGCVQNVPVPPPILDPAVLNVTVGFEGPPVAFKIQVTPDSSDVFSYEGEATRVSLRVPRGATSGADIEVTAPGYLPLRGRLTLLRDGSCEAAPLPVTGSHEVCLASLTSEHVDPSHIPLRELARIRGAMWTARWDGGLGPRPGQPTNIISTGHIYCFSPEEQDRMLEIYKGKGYTHVVSGPTWIPDSGAGYHGQWCPDPDFSTHMEDYFDILQKFWDHGLVPIIFIHPDNWSLEQTKALTPLFTGARAQRLMRVVVPTGWEPTRYGWSSWTWAEYGKWARETWPNALILLHTVQDVDAPVGEDERGIDTGTGNGTGWARVVPYFHGWLTQLGFYPGDAEGLQRFADSFNPNVRGSYPDRFQHGYAAWPTDSAWGPGQPLLVYAGEYAAYGSYWYDIPEAESIRWGNAAVAAGASGYLDGGSVEVPVQ